MRALAVALLLAATSACSIGNQDPESVPTPSPSAPESSPESSPDSSDPSESGSAAAGSPACVEVREGIKAFNAGDYPVTVAHFKVALPLARAQADVSGSSEADDLLEAVRYYARLAPADYPEAARSSPEFAKYKSITLGQCVPVPLDVLPDSDPTSPGADT